MNIFNDVLVKVKEKIENLMAAGELPAGLDLSRITSEPPRDPSHGDVATNAAMVLAKAAKMKPRDLAEKIVAALQGVPGIATAEIAGPGFINIRIASETWRHVVATVLQQGVAFGDSDYGQGDAVNIEYVSANPTGPMHIGHARGAVFGDGLAGLLAKAGFKVTREYYVNDAGAQVDSLAQSVFARYAVICGRMTEDELADKLARKEIQYGGDYLVPVAAHIRKVYGETLFQQPEAEILPILKAISIEKMMDLIRADLQALGVQHDVFSSEAELVKAGKVDEVLKWLEDRGHIYVGVLEPPKGKKPDDWEERPQTLFKSSEFGDDVDRALKKSDGSWTYFASDIAYHLDKYQRGFNRMIDVLGADHGGYVKRLKASVSAISDRNADVDVRLCQLVKLMENGQPVKMSKRAGTFVTLREVVEEVGKDVVRFMLLTRKNDQSIDFDFAKVREQSKDNPVFYVQYAHARAHSVMRQACEAFANTDFSVSALQDADLNYLASDAEESMMKLLAQYPRVVENAAETHEPHRVVYYIQSVAAEFHALWNKGKENTQLRFVDADNLDVTKARLALVYAVATVIRSGLHMFGIEPVEEMR
jgi:arginyl-tRNA synthetase